MWIPSPVYERIPQFYLLVGLLFITDGLYLGFDRSYAFIYVGAGIASSVYGIALFVMRRAYRKANPPMIDAS